jgi:hypothetical protein
MARRGKSRRQIPSDLAKNGNRELVQPGDPVHVQTIQFVRFRTRFEAEISRPLRPPLPARPRVRWQGL